MMQSYKYGNSSIAPDKLATAFKLATLFGTHKVVRKNERIVEIPGNKKIYETYIELELHKMIPYKIHLLECFHTYTCGDINESTRGIIYTDIVIIGENADDARNEFDEYADNLNRMMETDIAFKEKTYNIYYRENLDSLKNEYATDLLSDEDDDTDHDYIDYIFHKHEEYADF